MSVAVYVADSDHPGARPGTLQPAYRAWADGLLLRAEISGQGKPSGLSIRPTAQIGRVEPIGHYIKPLAVEPSLCFAAVSSDLLRLYFPPQWTEELLDYLVDQRFSRDLVEELVLPCDAPMVTVDVSRIESVLLETPPDLLRSIEAFFTDDINAYVRSVKPLLGSNLSEDEEVLIPMELSEGSQTG